MIDVVDIGGVDVAVVVVDIGGVVVATDPHLLVLCLLLSLTQLPPYSNQVKDLFLFFHAPHPSERPTSSAEAYNY
jgi:hypothetical protein